MKTTQERLFARIEAHFALVEPDGTLLSPADQWNGTTVTWEAEYGNRGVLSLYDTQGGGQGGVRNGARYYENYGDRPRGALVGSIEVDVQKTTATLEATARNGEKMRVDVGFTVQELSRPPQARQCVDIEVACVQLVDFITGNLRSTRSAQEA